MEELKIIPGTPGDIDEIAQLYDDVNDYLESHINYPGWIKGVYPNRTNAEQGVEEGVLYVACLDDRIIGSIIVNQDQENGYETVTWKTKAHPDEVAVIHTFLVHPDYLKSGIGKDLLDFAEEKAAKDGKKVIRLDVYEKNIPAIRLYEGRDYKYMGTADLGYGSYGLDWFRLYEKPLSHWNILLSKIKPLSEDAMEEARLRWAHVAKPLNSLGVLEDDIVKIAGIRETGKVDIGKRALIIMCSDNGIVEEGVTQTGQKVTAVVAENMSEGNSSVCIMADRAEVDVFPVDIGVTRDLTSGSRFPLIRRKVAYGTKNFANEPAMTKREAEQAIETGIQLVKELAGKGYGLIATGEMGIGNTTTSSAVCSMLLQADPEELTGRGAGLSKEGLRKKIRVVKDAIETYSSECHNPVDILAAVGGFDLAGLTGVFLGGAIYRIPIVIDGFISATAALAADKIYPGCRDYMLASHVSAEPAGWRVLDELKLSPLIQAGMCLGEGTGAVAAVPLLDMALEVYTKMSTFEDIKIEEYKPMGDE